MVRKHISPEDRIRHLIESLNFENERMRQLGETGTIEEIREHANLLAPTVSEEVSDPTIASDPPVLTREERIALHLIGAIDTFVRIEHKLKEEAEAAYRPARHPSEMDGVTPLTRDTLEGDRENY